MDVQSDFVDPATPSLSYDNVKFWSTEDSGYHTSFTPGSLECSEISNENLQPSVFQKKICFTGQIQFDCYNISPDVNFQLSRKHCLPKSVLNTRNEIFTDSPKGRRGVKRPYQEEPGTAEVSYSSVPTPTSLIAGGIQRLKVNENKINTLHSTSSAKSVHVDSVVSELYYLDECTQSFSFPTTPVKKICRTSCKLSPFNYNNHKSSPLRASNSVCCPPKRSVKKLNFATHSLSCESQGLQPALKHKSQAAAVKTFQFRPEQKIDIISMLYWKVCCTPVMRKIFGYLSNEDMYNFSLVSPAWLQICEDVSDAKFKMLEHVKHLKKAKENQENKVKGVLPKSNETNQMRSLKEIHNVINSHAFNNSVSPPGTPRTIRFKRFTKSASLDSRIQLSCVRCQQPAKVTEESSGEEWVECTSSTCSYQFCRFCKCERHPGKTCFQYDLEGPSPSKRKKTSCAVGTKKSRRNLRRLL